ncbi:sulfate transporter CysZ [Aliikangiella coralliicola]|uniref:Sulfate transporter CysZ n=1 Tax=Aliikangiella coralliicola TaxID=2592383 RepID=A0A545U4Z0_9GAMM|nr:sulfate transporter CysZ [Aliikangiella coralliicola]TQV84473.1 sulfate transporter CysZ [Aliikangiella coralliicola]
MPQSTIGGAQYLSKGLSLIWQPGVRAFVFIPLLINLVLLSGATFYAISNLSDWYEGLKNSEYSIVQWSVENMGWLLWPLIVISVLGVVIFFFAFIANWIAAPFNGLLSEAVERHLAGGSLNQQPTSMKSLVADIPRLLAREWRKLTYYLPRALGCLLLFVTPLAIIAPIIWFLFNSWMAAIQYIDYPMDNHKVPFRNMLDMIKQRRSGPFSFGAVVMLLTMIPVVNIFVMPVAVAGATNLWFDHYRE